MSDNREPLFSSTPDDPRHGTENGYSNLRCRCDRCTDAHATYYRVGPGNEAQWRSRTLSGRMRRRYRIAREAGYSAHEARRRQHWADPLAEESKR